MDIHTMVDPGYVILISDKKKWALKQWKDTAEPQKYLTRWKKPIWKATHCVMPTAWHSGKGTIMDNKKISSCQGLGGGKGWTGRAQKILKAVKTLSDTYNAAYMSLCVCPNPQNVHTEMNLMLRTLHEDEMASAGSGIVANVPSVERRRQWGGCTCEEQRVYGESSVLSS